MTERNVTDAANGARQSRVQRAENQILNQTRKLSSGLDFGPLGASSAAVNALFRELTALALASMHGVKVRMEPSPCVTLTKLTDRKGNTLELLQDGTGNFILDRPLGTTATAEGEYACKRQRVYVSPREALLNLIAFAVPEQLQPLLGSVPA